MLDFFTYLFPQWLTLIIYIIILDSQLLIQGDQDNAQPSNMKKRQGSRYVRKSPLRTREHVTASKGSGRKPHHQSHNAQPSNMNKRQSSRHVRKSPLRTGEHVTASKRSGGKPHNQTSRKFQPAKNRGVPTLANEEPDSDPEDDSEDKEDADMESKPDEDYSSGTMLRHRKQQGGRYIRKKNIVQRTCPAKQVDIEKSPPTKEVKFFAPAELGAQKAFQI